MSWILYTGVFVTVLWLCELIAKSTLREVSWFAVTFVCIGFLVLVVQYNAEHPEGYPLWTVTTTNSTGHAIEKTVFRLVFS